VQEIKYSIICCYYNEINLLNNKFISFVEEVKNFPFSYEVILCDNNSNDGTTEYLRELKNKNLEKLKFIFNDKNLGKGGSIKKAIDLSLGKYIVIFDLDEYLSKDLIKADTILTDNNQIDFLVGTRLRHQKKFIYKKNYYGVRIMTMLINYLYNTRISDAAGATKIFKKSVYSNFNISSSGFDFEFEVLCKFAKQGYQVTEFPIEYYPRSFEEGKKLRAFKDGSQILKTILKSYFI